MKRNRLYFILMGVVILLTTAIFLENPLPAGALESCNIIIIRGKGQGMPTDISVAKGDCVVWMNWNHVGEVAVVFNEYKKCIEGSESPVGFVLDEQKSCFVAQWIKYGETVSLVFNTPGKYDYEIVFNAGGSLKGSVTVKE